MSDVNQIGALAMDNLIAGSQLPVVDMEVEVATGEGALARGTALGKVLYGAAVAAAKAGGNTAGSGTISAVTLADGAKAGVWKVRMTAATTFTVVDPDGYTRGSGVAAAEYSNGIKFTITAGTTPFEVGDGFDITVAAGSGKFRKVNTANKDGSGRIAAILANDLDATSDDVVGVGYVMGEFNEGALVFGGDDSAADHRAAAGAIGIVFRTVR